MTTRTISRPLSEEKFRNGKRLNNRITIFHCFNAVGKIAGEPDDCEIRTISMPCSGMIREVVLLKAFEDGADAVIVLACPEGTCHYLEGNLRARKRVENVKKSLDEIGFDGRRLNIYNISPGDQNAIESIIDTTLSELAALGPSPAR